MKEMRLNDKFPELFEIDSEELKWYNSFGFVEGQAPSDYTHDEEARAFAMNTIIDPEDNPIAVDEFAENFKRGISWYISNFHIMNKLSAIEQESAFEIAKSLYSLKYFSTEITLEDDDTDEEEALDIIDSIEYPFECGFEWAEKNIDKGFLRYQQGVSK